MAKKKTIKSVRKTGKARRGGAGRRAAAPPPDAPAPTDIDVPPQEELISGQVRPLPALSSGPRKQRREGPPLPRLSNHKARATWFQNRATWPVREAPVFSLVREREAVRKTLPPAAGTAQWVGVGPTNIGGRVTSLVCHPQHPERLWAGAAGGGVWHSPDAGQSWQSQWYSQDVLNVGSLAIDPVDPRVLYCGTGEANLSADSYPGVGIYRTQDGGQSWHLHASVEKAGLPRRIGVIAIDPFDRRHLRVGGVGYGEVGAAGKDFGGMYTSTDGGVTWRRETFVSTQNYWCHSVVFHPRKRGVIYATFTARGARNGIYRTEDGGLTWQRLTSGLPLSAAMGRTTLAISRSHPDVLYAFAANEWSASADRLLGIYRTANGGRTWKEVAGTHFAGEGQISYGNTIVVSPTDPNHVLCGGVDLHLTRDGGRTWRRVTRWDAARGASNYAHADHHCLLMPPQPSGRVYDANDGGLDLSEDGGRKWINRSNGLAVTMYYDLDVAQTDPDVYGGGAQDNGTLITLNGAPDDHFELLGGDGGWIVFDPQDANHVFASYQHMGIYRFRGGRYAEVTPPAGDDERNSVWMCFIAMDPSNRRTVFTASNRVWRTKTDGDSWTPVSPTLDGSPVTAIEIARADPRRIYIGTENGNFFRSLDGGDSWSPNLSGPDLPGYTITRLASSPQAADVLYATVANFGHSHVYRSDDGGLNWADVDQRRLPDVPHHSVVIPPDSPQTVFVCNDVGVFVSPDAGETWMNLTRNLPNVMVVDLAYHEAEGTLTAATYGRSLWRLHVKPV